MRLTVFVSVDSRNSVFDARVTRNANLVSHHGVLGYQSIRYVFLVVWKCPWFAVPRWMLVMDLYTSKVVLAYTASRKF